MTHEQLQHLAFMLGLNPRNAYTSQTEVIRNIQLQRGTEACFLTEKRYACAGICEWSQERRKLRAHWKR